MMYLSESQLYAIRKIHSDAESWRAVKSIFMDGMVFQSTPEKIQLLASLLLADAYKEKVNDRSV